MQVIKRAVFVMGSMERKSSGYLVHDSSCVESIWVTIPFWRIERASEFTPPLDSIRRLMSWFGSVAAMGLALGLYMARCDWDVLDRVGFMLVGGGVCGWTFAASRVEDTSAGPGRDYTSSAWV